VVDAETGRTIPVEYAPREGGVSVRFFMDGFPTMGAEDGKRFEVRLPHPEARMEVRDPRLRYFDHEETIRVTAVGGEHIVRLRPTHRVLLRGRVLDARTGRPARLGKTMVSLGGGDGAGGVSVDPDDHGRFEAYVPRDVLTFGYVNPEVMCVEDTLDLRGVQGDVVERTLYFTRAFE
jgi:hypothetical protein